MDRATIEEPEEGEIVDDLETISDYSMPSTPTSGKSVHTRDLLQDISLSSISDTSADLATAITKKSKHRKRKRRRSLKKYVVESSDSDIEDPVKQKQLKSIRVNTEIHHNSLRTRLKAMLGDNKPSEEEKAEHDTLQTLDLLSTEEDTPKGEEKRAKCTENGKEETDDELRQLRFDALKSAVIMKAMKRKRKKGKENDANKDNENCDNIYVTEPNPEKPETQDKPVETVENLIEDDVDVMRAIALASLSKNIANVVAEQPKNSAEFKELTKKTEKVTISKNPPQKKATSLQLKQIKPLIINLESSDSEDGAITDFLKKQRAAIEEKEKKVDQKAPEGAPKDKLVDKSVLRLLPKSQQVEYRLLQQKLLLAQKKRDRLVKNGHAVVKKKNGVASAEVKVPNGQKAAQNGARGTKFQKTLEDMQERLQGRLQLKGKYRRLVPLLKQVNKVSIERQKHRKDFERLLKELQTVKDKLHTSHQTYARLAQQITNEKLKIDRRFSKTIAEKKQCTSTPLKNNLPESMLDISSIHNSVEVPAKVENAEEKSDDPLKKYVSPLDTKKSNTIPNPMTTYCPFELFGVCKDPECKFNHCATTT